GRRSYHDVLALPAPASELAPEHLGDVRLDADRAAVPIVRGTIRPALEGADVAERAAMSTAHVRVERPAEHHPGDPVQGGAAGLLAVLRLHLIEYRTFVRSAMRKLP